MMRFFFKNFDMARVWARNYISTLAKDKNVALVSGAVPDNAKFYLGDEIIVDGKLLEIELPREKLNLGVKE